VHETLIRDATLEDAATIAGLHLASWRSVYRGILPDAYLDGPAEAERLAHWTKVLAEPRAGDVVLLHGQAGFAAVRGRAEGLGALLDNLHVDPAQRGGGIGTKLLAELARRLVASGETALHLWVLDGNDRAVAFYRRHGAAIEGGRPGVMFGAPVHSTLLVFRDLARLAQARR
jgi:ribosomal protein S18 acetylase RimI-like enzyme